MKKLTAPYLMLGTASNCPDIRYATSFVAPDDVVVLCLERKTVLIVSSMEYGRAQKQSVNCIVESPITLNLSGSASHTMADWVLGALRKYNVHDVSVNARFPLGTAREIESAGIPVTIARSSKIDKQRTVKDAREIACIAESQKAARAAMQAVGKAIVQADTGPDGVLIWQGQILTAERAREIVRHEVLAFDCIDEETIIAGGAQGADPHEAGTGPLKAGEWIVCDIFPRSLRTGYWGDMTRTFMNGSPTAPQKKMFNAVKAAQKLALSLIRPGVKGSAVHDAVCRHFIEAGFETFMGADNRPRGFFHSTGHGVGLEIHEEPRLSPSGGVLQKNMLVTVEPGLYYPERGGVRIEDLVVVTDDGVKIL